MFECSFSFSELEAEQILLLKEPNTKQGSQNVHKGPKFHSFIVPVQIFAEAMKWTTIAGSV